jgi:hypothetical protein
MADLEKIPPDEDQAVEALRDFLIRPEEVPPEIAARVKAAIREEAFRVSNVSWAEGAALFSVAFLLVGSIVPLSLTLPLLEVCGLVSGLYVLGIRRLYREASP